MGFKANKNSILYLLTFAFWAVFYYFLPFAGDDWAWGSDIGIERLSNLFDGYNGRYLGNLLIIIITRSVVARIIICSLTMLLLIFILSKIFGNISSSRKSTDNFLIAFISVLILVLPNQITFGDLQPFQIFGSTIGWLSGFTNYVVPSVLILVFYYFVTSKGYNGITVCILLAVDGLLACLCVEHYTLFCILFSGAVIAYRYCFGRRICKKALSFLCGSLVGGAIMFTNSSYRLMQSGDVSNNQRAVGFIGSLKQYAAYIFPKGASRALIITFEIALLILILSFIIFMAIKLYRAVRHREIAGLLPIICLVTMTLPLLFTNSGKEIYIVAPRCYFLQYFMLVIYLYGKLAKKHTEKFDKGLKACLAVLLAVACVIYIRLDYMGAVRDRLVDEALESGSSSVDVLEYPENIAHIQWASNFIDERLYLERYRNYKGIPEDISINVTPYIK